MPKNDEGAGLEIVQHPGISTNRICRNGHIFPVVRRNSPGGLEVQHLPSECGFPIKSTYNRVDTRSVELLETKNPLPSAAQSMEVKLFQSFTVISGVGWPESEISWADPGLCRKPLYATAR